MPGPPPKDPTIRQRRNRASTASTLDPGAIPKRAPALPTRKKPGWHVLVRAWWKDLWRSPMAAKFLQVELHGLYILADLRDRYWRGEVELASEIRLQEARFGLDQLARWRLQWEIHENPKTAPKAETAAPVPPPPPAPAQDPRRLLSMVKR